MRVHDVFFLRNLGQRFLQDVCGLRLAEVIAARHAGNFPVLVQDGEAGNIALPCSPDSLFYRDLLGQGHDVADHGVGHVNPVQEVFGFMVGQRDPVL